MRLTKFTRIALVMVLVLSLVAVGPAAAAPEVCEDPGENCNETDGTTGSQAAASQAGSNPIKSTYAGAAWAVYNDDATDPSEIWG